MTSSDLSRSWCQDLHCRRRARLDGYQADVEFAILIDDARPSRRVGMRLTMAILLAASRAGPRSLRGC